MRRLLAAAVLAAIGTASAAFLSATNTRVLDLGAAFAQASEADTSLVEEMTLGNPDATVTVVEYASFTCPHCRSFHENAFKELKAEYIDTGKVQFIYREVYFDRFGLWAGLLARCGGRDRYFGFVDALYASQSDWTAGGDPATIAGNLRKLGRTAGLTDEEVNACLSDQAMAEAMLEVYQTNAAADEINSTPSFVINGTKYSNMSYDAFRDIIDEALGS
ncbi:MAG: DsbA family protein [Pseudomonadota bacterium]